MSKEKLGGYLGIHEKNKGGKKNIEFEGVKTGEKGRRTR